MSSITRGVRRMAFQALFQLEAHNGQGLDLIARGLDEEHPTVPANDRALAMKLAQDAWANRFEADKIMAELAPTWPAHRQAAVDRAILRLAHFDMTKGSGKTKPKVVVNDSVEFAKEFSTEKSPGFVNALLDKVLKLVVGSAAGSEDAVEPRPPV
jgi:N utilization substance protein B